MLVDEQSEFLGIEHVDELNRIFGAKRAGGKVKIEIGIQELTLKVKQKEMGFYGEQMVLKFWKPPFSVPNLKSPVSYHTIDCIHLLRNKRIASFRDNWFKSFTTCLDEKSFKVINKGDKFLCLIMQQEQTFSERNGEAATYNKGERSGEEIVVVKPNIISVHPLGTKVEFNYFDLYKKLNNESRD